MRENRGMMVRKDSDSESRYPMSLSDVLAALFRPKPKRFKGLPTAEIPERPGAGMVAKDRLTVLPDHVMTSDCSQLPN